MVNCNTRDGVDVENMIDNLTAAEQQQSNCMFQLALMLARISLEPVSEDFKEQATQVLLELVRAKPKSRVVRLFGATRSTAESETICAIA